MMRLGNSPEPDLIFSASGSVFPSRMPRLPLLSSGTKSGRFSFGQRKTVADRQVGEWVDSRSATTMSALRDGYSMIDLGHRALLIQHYVRYVVRLIVHVNVRVTLLMVYGHAYGHPYNALSSVGDTLMDTLMDMYGVLSGKMPVKQDKGHQSDTGQNGHLPLGVTVCRVEVRDQTGGIGGSAQINAGEPRRPSPQPPQTACGGMGDVAVHTVEGWVAVIAAERGLTGDEGGE